jgi:hypothetical protein
MARIAAHAKSFRIGLQYNSHATRGDEGDEGTLPDAIKPAVVGLTDLAAAGDPL